MVKTFSPYSHTENGSTSFESPEYFGEVQTDEKPDMMLKRVRFHTVTQQRADVIVPLCTCKVRLTAIVFSRCQEKKQNKNNIKNMIRVCITLCSFLRKPNFLLSAVGCEEKWQKRRGEPKDQKVKSEKRDTLMKQENTTGQGVVEWRGVWSFEEFAARSEVLRRQERRTDITLNTT